MTERVRITVRGLVQGVGFRWHTRRQALALGLRGEVSNLPDGAVLIVAEGERAALEALLAWALEGPQYAAVATADASWEGAEGGYPDFLITG
jgi:acylphosphatase